MHTYFTKKEAVALLRFMRNEFDVVRVVDPKTRRILTTNFRQTSTEEFCHSIWGRCERCENCTSLRALEHKNNAYKIEFIDGKVFLIISKYMDIEGQKVIMEILSDATKDFLANSNEKNKIAEIIQQHNHLIISDELTGLYNRRFLNEYFLPSLNCCHDENITVNLAIMDIDKFKKVNDNYGHLAGDHLLCDVSGFWKLHFDSRQMNNERIVIRYGGDEIMIITCNTSFDDFRQMIKNYYDEMRKVCYYDNQNIPFTLSFGLASTEEFPDQWDWKNLFEKADKRLYANKKDRHVK